MWLVPGTSASASAESSKSCSKRARFAAGATDAAAAVNTVPIVAGGSSTVLFVPPGTSKYSEVPPAVEAGSPVTVALASAPESPSAEPAAGPGASIADVGATSLSMHGSARPCTGRSTMHVPPA